MMKRNRPKAIAPIAGPAERYAATIKGLDTRLLRHFSAVVECKGFTLAAESLHITQPALTKSVQSLENRLGVKLLERQRNAVVPTLFGQILANRAKLIDLEIAHAVSEIQTLKEGYVGTVNIGVGPSLVSYLPKAIVDLQNERANLRALVTVNVMEPLVSGLLAGDLDVIFTAMEFPDYPDIAKEPLFHMEHVLAGRIGHPLSGRGKLTADQLLDHRWVTFSKTHMGTSRLGSYFAANHLPPPSIAVSTTSIEMMFALARKSDYLITIPGTLLRSAEASGLCELPLKGSFWKVSLGIAYRRSTHQIPAVEAMIENLRGTELPDSCARLVSGKVDLTEKGAPAKKMPIHGKATQRHPERNWALPAFPTVK